MNKMKCRGCHKLLFTERTKAQLENHVNEYWLRCSHCNGKNILISKGEHQMIIVRFQKD